MNARTPSKISPKTSDGRYSHIDAMRAFAVMVVVVAHTNVGGIPGGSGVTMFFTISGFIIAHLLLRERERTGGFSLRNFYARRAFKLAPPFLAIVLIPSVIYAALGGAIAWPYVATQTFFVFNWATIVRPFGPVEILPGSSLVWSLSVEEQFYILFAVVWLLIVRRPNFRRLLLGVSLVGAIFPLVLRIILASYGGLSERIYLGTDTRLDGIAIGVLCAVIYAEIQRGRLRKTKIALAQPALLYLAVAVYVCTLVLRDEWFRDTFRFTLQSLVAAAIILWGLLDRDSRTRLTVAKITDLRVVQTLGLASYSIYLAHASVFVLLETYLRNLPRVIEVPILISCGTVAGVAAWKFIERPAEKAKHRYELHAKAPRPRKRAPARGR